MRPVTGRAGGWLLGFWSGLGFWGRVAVCFRFVRPHLCPRGYFLDYEHWSCPCPEPVRSFFRVVFSYIFIVIYKGKLSPIVPALFGGWQEFPNISIYIYILVFYLFYKLWISPLKFIIFKMFKLMCFTVLSLDEPTNFKFQHQPQTRFP